ncbi:MAG: rRNA maturation RNase YbeY [Bacteroidales bacterium]|nr:rRNA maturation RNase YbeY [Bacteroidales bacterium]
MNSRVYYDNVKYRINRSKETLEMLKKVIVGEMKEPGDLSFIITDDKELIKINREFLKHDYFTDVIAFAENDGGKVSGEIYISIDTVRRNARNYKVSLTEELFRVMVHGVLHLCGYKDGTEEGKKRMRILEDWWIEKWKMELWNSDMI